MEKTKTFQRLRFDSKTFYEVNKILASIGSSKITYSELSVEVKGEIWRYDTIQEFLAVVDSGWPHFRARADKGLRVASQQLGRTL